MRASPRLAVSGAALVAAMSLPSFAQPQLTTEQVVDGLFVPLFVTHPPGDEQRLFVLEQRGDIEIIDLGDGTGPGEVLPQPFLDLTDEVSQTGNERGLLGLAFHPDFEQNGFFYVNFTDRFTHDTEIVRYQVSDNDPNLADPDSATPVLGFDQPFSNHNGGWIGFGPDGFLYVSSGDGGSGNDPLDNGQDTSVLLGKLLRIDVDADDFPADPDRNYAIPDSNPFVGQSGRDEIWAYGLRNPWRASFDRETGDLWIADVGQNAREEVNFQPASSKGGENYGWRLREGTIPTPSVGGPRPPDNVDPIWDYSHSLGCSITGGYVYRGCRIPGLQGTYFAADFCSGRIWTFEFDGQDVINLVQRQAELDPPGGDSISSITSFGQDARGDLYIVDRGGEIFRVLAADGSNGCICAPDLTGPGGDGVPDGALTADDFFFYLGLFADGDLDADLTGPGGDGNPDGTLTADDFFFYLGLFAEGCP